MTQHHDGSLICPALPPSPSRPRPPAPDSSPARPTRRQVLAGAGGTGLLAAAGPISILGAARPARAASAGADGTPEQIHLAWGADPSSSMTVSWASPGEARGARVHLRLDDGWRRTIPAIQRVYTDGLNGETVWTYHAEITGLRPGTTYSYTVTADNDSSEPFASTFATAPRDRAPFRLPRQAPATV